MDRIDYRVRTQKKCKFISESMRNKDIVWYIKGKKHHVLIVEEIRT